jgi:hypothetical protein
MLVHCKINNLVDTIIIYCSYIIPYHKQKEANGFPYIIISQTKTYFHAVNYWFLKNIEFMTLSIGKVGLIIFLKLLISIIFLVLYKLLWLY